MICFCPVPHTDHVGFHPLAQSNTPQQHTAQPERVSEELNFNYFQLGNFHQFSYVSFCNWIHHTCNLFSSGPKTQAKQNCAMSSAMSYKCTLVTIAIVWHSKHELTIISVKADICQMCKEKHLKLSWLLVFWKKIDQNRIRVKNFLPI